VYSGLGHEILALRKSRGWPRGVGRSGVTEELVPMQVEREPLKEPSNVEKPIAAPGQHLHAIVEALHKPAGLPTLEVDGPPTYNPKAHPVLTHSNAVCYEIPVPLVSQPECRTPSTAVAGNQEAGTKSGRLRPFAHRSSVYPASQNQLQTSSSVWRWA
jgi:hypothetical protein